MTLFELIPASSLAVFFVASVGLALAPGPDNLYVLSVSMARGSVPGLAITIGLCTGLLAHTAAVVLGVAVIIQNSWLAFTLLKVAGALYLLYLAWQAYNAASQGIKRTDTTLSTLALYRRGIFMNITNPKVSLFFLAFLPQFSQPSAGNTGIQLLALGAIFMIAALLVFSVIALLAGKVGHLVQENSLVQPLLQKLTALIFVGLAIKLLVTRQ